MSGEIQTGRTPLSAETPTDSRWQATPGPNPALARSGNISDTLNIRCYTDNVKELQREACVHREWAGYVLPLYPYSGGMTNSLFLAHDFCGRRCAQEFNSNGQRPSPPPRDVICVFPQCRNRVFVNADGNATKFCSRRHGLYVPWMVTTPKLLLIQMATNSAAVQRGLADVCLLCVASRVLPDIVLNHRFYIKLQGNAHG